jgi:hypothetical protein
MARLRRVVRGREREQLAKKRRDEDVLRRVALDVAEKKLHLCNKRWMRMCLRCWRLELRIRACALGCVRDGMKAVARAWCAVAAHLGIQRRAATKIQARRRGIVEQRKAAAFRATMRANEAKAMAMLGSLVRWVVFVVF